MANHKYRWADRAEAERECVRAGDRAAMLERMLGAQLDGSAEVYTVRAGGGVYRLVVLRPMHDDPSCALFWKGQGSASSMVNAFGKLDAVRGDYTRSRMLAGDDARGELDAILGLFNKAAEHGRAVAA